MESPINIYYSYAQSPQDEALLTKLENHLKSLERVGLIKGWHRRNLIPGQVTDNIVTQHIQQADIILLLVSADYLAASHYEAEVTQAMALQRQGKARVIPILLRPVAYTLTPFAELAVLPSNGKPVINWAHGDDAFANIVEGIQSVIQCIPPAHAARTNTPGQPVQSTQSGRPREERYSTNFYGPVQGMVIGGSNTVTNYFYGAPPQPNKPSPSASEKQQGDDE